MMAKDTLYLKSYLTDKLSQDKELEILYHTNSMFRDLYESIMYQDITIIELFNFTVELIKIIEKQNKELERFAFNAKYETICCVEKGTKNV